MESPSLFERLNASRRRNSSAAALDELHQTLSNLEQRLAEFEEKKSRQPMRPMPAESRRAAGPARPPVARETLPTNDETLAEIAEQLRRLAPSDGNEPIEQVAARQATAPQRPAAEPQRHYNMPPADLAQQANAQLQERVVELSQKFDALSGRIDVLADRSLQPDPSVTELISQLDRLAQTVVGFFDASGKIDLREIETRLDQIDLKLASVEASTQASQQQIFAELDRKFLALNQRFDTHLSDHKEQSREDERKTMNALESKLGAFSQQLSRDIAEAISSPVTKPVAEPAVPGFDPNNAFQALDRQIAHIVTLLEQPNAEIASIKPRLDSIEQSLSATTERALAKVQEVAEEIVSRAVRDGAANEASLAKKLANDIKSLESLSQDVDRRQQNDLGNIQQALSDIGTRLSQLESSKSEAATVAVEKPQAVTEPVRVEPPVVPVAPQAQPAPSAPQTTEKPALAATPSAPVATPVNPPVIDQRPVASNDEEKLPDLNAIVRRLRAQTVARDVVQSEAKTEPASSEAKPDDAAPDLVTSARRSVLRSSIDVNVTANESKPAEDPDKTPDPSNRRRKSILFALGAALVALAGLQLSLTLKSGQQLHDQTTQIAKPQPVANAAPAADKASDRTASKPAEKPDNLQVDNSTIVASVSGKSDRMPGNDVKLAEQPLPQRFEAETASMTRPELPQNFANPALQAALSRNEALALYEIADRYQLGTGVAADPAKAAEWFRLASDMNFAPAQFRLASLYADGLGVARDYAMARTLYEKAALQGNLTAMHNLAVLYAGNDLGTPDNAQAVRWFANAAELGMRDSQYNLAVMRAKGIGTPVNLEDSYKWFAIAANHGDVSAAQKRNLLAETMAADALDRARAAAENWQAKPQSAAANQTEVPADWRDAAVKTSQAAQMQQAVRNMQMILRNNGYAIGNVDGVIDDKTKQAVIAFRKDNNLSADFTIDQTLVELLLEKNKISPVK